MHQVITSTLGGLSAQYYFRHFVFGLIFPILFIVASNSGNEAHGVSIGMYLLIAVNTLLYPYARFVYEGVVGFVMGGNVFFVNAVLMLSVKAMTMAACWGGAILIAPMGFAYLFYYHSKAGIKYPESR